MAPTNYQRGRQFEYRTRNKLLKMGAVYVMRAASSKGAADLLALWPGDLAAIPTRICPYERPWLIQTKYSANRRAYIPVREKDDLIAIADKTGALPVFARPGPNGRGVEFINLYTEEPIG